MRLNYYDVLGLRSSATAEEIKKAYRKLAKTSHPDVSSKPNAAEQFVKIAEAFEILSDPDKRAVYDHRLRRDRLPPTRSASPRPSSGQGPGQQAQYEAWVRQARARANSHSQMPYDSFKRKSKLEKADLEAYFYVQYFLLGVVLLMAFFLLVLPLYIMLIGFWWGIFLAVPLTPFAFKLYDEVRKAYRQMKS